MTAQYYCIGTALSVLHRTGSWPAFDKKMCDDSIIKWVLGIITPATTIQTSTVTITRRSNLSKKKKEGTKKKGKRDDS